MKADAKRVHGTLRAALLCGLTLLCCLCAPVRGAGEEQLEQLLATERQALQDILNNPNTIAGTKALVREMLDWNARGGTCAEFQRTHLPPPAATQHTAAHAAGDAIFGGHTDTSAHAVAAPRETGSVRAVEHLEPGRGEGPAQRAVTPAPAGKQAVAAWGEPDTFAVPRLQPRGGMAPAKLLPGTGPSALPARKEPVAAWVEDAHFGPLQPLQPRHEPGAAQQVAGPARAAVELKREQTAGARTEPNSAGKKTYTGPLVTEAGGKGTAYPQNKVLGGKGEFYRQQMEADQQRLKEQASHRAPQTALTPLRSKDSDMAHVRNTALTPAVAVKPALQIMMVDSFCPKHGKYGGQYKVGEKVECPRCKADKAQSVAAAGRPPLTIHTPPPKPAAPAAPAKPQIMMVDSFCLKHGAYGGQYRVGEKVECPRCKAERAAAAAAGNKPLIGSTIAPPKPASSQLAMVDAFCPKHKLKYGGQVHPGEKLECPKCKAERGQAATATVHTPPPKPAAPQVALVDAFCPKHKIKYGGQVRPGEKIECPKCKEEKNKGVNYGSGFIR